MAELGPRYGDAVTFDLIAGRRGVFDVLVDGDLVFSKHRRHRFPGSGEIAAAIDDRLSPPDPTPGGGGV